MFGWSETPLYSIDEISNDPNYIILSETFEFDLDTEVPQSIILNLSVSWLHPWLQLPKLTYGNNITNTNTKNTQTHIQIHPTFFDDCCKLIKILGFHHSEYFTFSIFHFHLPLKTELINLRSKCFPPKIIKRMTKAIAKFLVEMAHAVLLKSDEDVYNMQVLFINTTNNSPKPKKEIGRCFRWHSFGQTEGR